MGCLSGDLHTPSGRNNSGRSFRRLSSAGHQSAQRGAGSFIFKHNLASSSKPNSSVESLMAYTLSNSNSPSVGGRTQASLSSSPASSPLKQGATDDTKSWMASSVNSTPSWRSASPNSSTGSGQLLFSLPPKQTLVDAASLRKSLPHGTTLNEYISRIFSGEETQFVTSGYQRPHRRKSSLDEEQPSLPFPTTGDLISRSTSLRQPSEMRPKTDKSGAVAPSVGGTRPSMETRAASLLPVQSLPQMPVPAQVQRIVFPEKMTAISTSVRPQGRAFGEPLLSTVGGHSMSSYSPDDSPGSMVQPLHSTPIPLRYQMHQAHVANIPMPYGTPVNLRHEAPVNTCNSGSFDPSLTVPSYAFPVTPVITAAEVDYRGGKLTTSMLDYTRPVATGLSVFGQKTTGAQPLFFTPSSSTSMAQEPLPRSDPPAYHEWQAAAHAMAALQRQAAAAAADQIDRYAFDLVHNRVLDEQTAANDKFLSLSSYLIAPLPPHSVSEGISADPIPVDVTYDIIRGSDLHGDAIDQLDGHVQSVQTSENQVLLAIWYTTPINQVNLY